MDSGKIWNVREESPSLKWIVFLHQFLNVPIQKLSNQKEIIFIKKFWNSSNFPYTPISTLSPFGPTMSMTTASASQHCCPWTIHSFKSIAIYSYEWNDIKSDGNKLFSLTDSWIWFYYSIAAAAATTTRKQNLFFLRKNLE